MVPDFWCCVDPARVELGGPSRYTKDGANTHQHAVLNSAYRLMRGDNTTCLHRNFGVLVGYAELGYPYMHDSLFTLSEFPKYPRSVEL